MNPLGDELVAMASYRQDMPRQLGLAEALPEISHMDIEGTRSPKWKTRSGVVEVSLGEGTAGRRRKGPPPNLERRGSELRQKLATRGMSEATAVKVLSRAVGSTVLCASTSSQEALEGYGLFYALVEELKEMADPAVGDFITTLSLINYVGDRVPSLAEQVYHREQLLDSQCKRTELPFGKGD